MPIKPFREWRDDLAAATSVDRLSELIKTDIENVEKEMRRIIAIATQVFFAISRTVERLPPPDRGMFDVLDPLFSDRNHMLYDIRSVFLKQRFPSQSEQIDEATEKALAFCDSINIQTNEGRSYLEMQRTGYERSLHGSFDDEGYRACAGAAALYEVAHMVKERIDNVRNLVSTEEFDAFMDEPLSVNIAE